MKKTFPILEQLGIVPLRSMGQNFLTNRKILQKIIRRSRVSDKDRVLEIGPGTGTLTRALLKKTPSIIAVEKDRKLFSYLTEYFSDNPQIRLIQGDFLKLSFSEIPFFTPPLKVIANIPYNISSQIILKIIMHSELFPEVFLSMQKEVAERLCANEGSKVYGLLTPLVKLEYHPQILFSIPPESFTPPPRVISAFFFMKRHRILPREIKEAFLVFLKLSFSHRRKKLMNNLKKKYDEKDLLRFLKELNIDEKARAENLNPEEFYGLFKKLRDTGENKLKVN